MANFDIAIVGGGIAGASLGAHLAAHRNVVLLEREEHCGYHATGRSAAFWLESYGGPHIAPLTAASHAFLERPPADFADRGFLRQRGAVHLSQQNWPKLPGGVEASRLDRAQLDRLIPGLRPKWRRALLEPGCADIDVAALHASYLRQFRKGGGTLLTRESFGSARCTSTGWEIELGSGDKLNAMVVVNAAGAWADEVAHRSGVRPLGIAPKRRTMVQLKIGRTGLRDLPLVDDSAGTFYFKGESDSSIWLTPHDEADTDPCDAAPEEIDIALAIDRLENVVDWPVERVERSWAGLRSFAPDRLPVYGFDAGEPGFFWCAGQGGYGIQTAPAAAALAASVLLGEKLPRFISHLDPTIFSPRRFD